MAMRFFDSGDTVRIDLGNGNWVDVLEMDTIETDEAYKAAMVTFTTGGQANVRSSSTERAYCESRITDWHLVEETKGGLPREIPFSKDMIRKMNLSLAKLIQKKCIELDGKFAVLAGTDDPNA